MMDHRSVLERIKGGLIVSCQALENEPLFSSFIMSRMALAAQMGGAIGIRANTSQDIVAIKEVVNLPVIGIVKRDYKDSPIYITPTLKEVAEVISAGAEIVAMDATDRIRPNGQTLERFFKEVRERFPSQLFMADISTFEEGIKASELGFDIVATTLSGYTEYTKDAIMPNIELVRSLSAALEIPVMAEGGYSDVEDVKRAIQAGAHACIVGSAITRPMEITKRFVAGLQQEKERMI